MLMNLLILVANQMGLLFFDSVGAPYLKVKVYSCIHSECAKCNYE